MRCFGFTLTELLVSLSVLSVLLGFAAPSWRQTQDKVQLISLYQQLIHDVQTARVQALQRGTTLKLLRTTGCAWGSSNAADWSCGWQLQVAETGEVLASHRSEFALRIVFSNATPLSINGQGNLSGLGVRWVFQTAAGLTQVVCINTTGRIRSTVGDTCS